MTSPATSSRIVTMLAIPLVCLVPAGQSAAQDAAGSPDVTQDGPVTRGTSTATINRRPDQDTRLEPVGTLKLFTEETVEPHPSKGIYQKGRGATARIDLSGQTNAAAIRQTGDARDGADGSLAVISLGNDSALANHSIAYIDQQGDQNGVRIQHQGNGNASVGIQSANLAGNGSGAQQTHQLAGRDHRSEAVQRADGAIAGITLSQGNRSRGLVRQLQRGAKASIGIKNGPGSAAQIAQIGPGRGSQADVDIDGKANETKILQAGTGGAHEATVTQSGEAAQAIVVQEGDRSHVGAISQSGQAGKAVIRQQQASGNKGQIGQEGARSRGLDAAIEQRGTGGRNKADIDQSGRMQSAFVRQDGTGGGSVAAIDQSTDGTDENDAVVDQIIDTPSGTDTVDIDQGGNANSAKASQKRSFGGTGSNVTITQPGMRGNAVVTQDGPSLKAQLDQNGNGNRGTIDQTGTGAAAEATIKAGGGTDGNEGAITQKSGGAIAAIDQGSPNNKAQIVQDNPDPAGGTIEADIDQSAGVQNQAAIEQSGPGTVRSASIAQSGRENEAGLIQQGAGNGIVAALQSAGNRNNVDAVQIGDRGAGLTLESKQQGDRNDIRFEQRGAGLSATLTQNGNGNMIDMTQSGSGYDISITQSGDRNSFKIDYSGPAEGGGGFAVTQSGGETRDER